MHVLREMRFRPSRTLMQMFSQFLLPRLFTHTNVVFFLVVFLTKNAVQTVCLPLACNSSTAGVTKLFTNLYTVYLHLPPPSRLHFFVGLFLHPVNGVILLMSVCTYILST